MSNKIYYTEWFGTYTAKQYRLEVYPADTPLSTPQYVKLDAHCVELDNFEWEFDDICFGINSNVNLKVKWYLDYLDNLEFETILFNPLKTYQLETDIDSVPYQAGNVYELYIDSVCVYRGVQLTDEAFGFDGTGLYTAETTSLAKHLMTCFDLKQFIGLESHLNRLHNKLSPCIYEYFEKVNSNTWRALMAITDKSDSKSNDNYYAFWDLQSFENWIKGALQSCSNAILRKTVPVTFEIPFGYYYKQDYAGNQALGSLLAKADVRILTYISKSDKTIGGVFAWTNDSMGGRYSTIYDLMSDWAQGEGMKYFISPDGTSMKPLPLFGKNPTVHNIETKSIELKSIKKRLNKQVTVSLSEFNSGDVDNYRYNDGIPRNDNELQIPLLWNNSPPKNNYEKKSIEQDYRASSGFAGGLNGNLYFTIDPVRMWNFYYTDTPEGLLEERAFRVHDFCRVDTRVRNDIGTEGIGTEPTVASVDWDSLDNASAFCLAIQVEHSKPSMFRRFNTYFGADKVSKASFIVPFDDAFADIMSGANSLITIDLTQYRQSLGTYPSNYYITKVSFDFEKEQFNVEAIGVFV